MENASKALLIAGGMLITGLILSLLVFGYNQIRENERAEISVKEVQNIRKFNKKFTAYMRDDLHGADILSVVNIINDYNSKYLPEDGYEPIVLSVEVKSNIGTFNGNVYNSANYGLVNFTNLLNDYETEKSRLLSKLYKNKSIDQLAAMYENELEYFLNGIPNTLAKHHIKTERTQYSNLMSSMSEFMSREFKFVSSSEGINGRLVSLKYEEK